MVDIFPTGRFGFGEQEVNIERQTLRGGTALSGEQDVVSTDGGGRVFAEFAKGPLVDRALNLAWRALVTILEEGVTPVIVPFCDLRHQPYGAAAITGGVPHSDGSPFDDETLYVSGANGGQVAAEYPLRSTTIRILTSIARPLIGGEWFSIEHPTKNWRAYRIARVFPVEGAPGAYDVTFRPPLREAVGVGEGVELLNPRCLMIMDQQANTRLEHHRYGEAAIRFVEAP